jgi:DNA-binding beta-propeller fold protein YncE
MRIALLVTFVLGLALPAASAELPAPTRRYPVAAARLDEATLAVANERSGTVSFVDLAAHEVAQELRLGKRLSALAMTSEGVLLVTDAQSNELIACRRKNETWDESARVTVDRDPQSVVASIDGRSAYVATRWSRRLSFVTIDRAGALTVEHSLALPFNARRLLLLPDENHLVVADAFGGQLAVVDVQKRAIVSTRDVQGSNLYGLAWDAANERLLIAHQILAPLPVTEENVQWGAVLKNVVRIVDKDQLLNPRVNLATATRVVSLGQEGEGSADPTAVLPLADGGFAVTLSGVNELAMSGSTGLVRKRIALGRRPIALLEGRRDDELVAINHFDDSLTIANVDTGKAETISLGPTPPLTTPERGEQLFYDARLSFDGWMSCHSCHTDGHTTGQRADTLGDGSFGAPKRTLTLLGTRDTDRWAWTGEMKELSEQVRKTVETSMHGRATNDQVFDLTAFLHTLEPPPPLEPRTTDDKDVQQLARGQQVFATQRCNQCHIGPLTYTSHDAYDVGLADENKLTKFNPPSLRGVSQGTRFFHDGRATSLEDVLDTYDHQVQGTLSDTERADLLRFLRSL